jgi:hypothetical protein
MSSILTDTKKNLGIADEYTAFDQDIILHINSVFNVLNQISVGPEEGFDISDKTAEWNDFLGGDKRLNAVKTYVYLRVRLLFDPPQTSFHIAALENQYKELEWRLNVQRESSVWVDPTVTVPNADDEMYILDGGDP